MGAGWRNSQDLWIGCQALFFSPAVSPTTLTFATFLPWLKPWAASGAAGLEESKGDELRRGSQSVSQHAINHSRRAS